MSFGAGPNGLLWKDGDEAVDLSGLGEVFAQATLNPLMAQGRAAWREATAIARAHDVRPAGHDASRTAVVRDRQPAPVGQ